MYYHHQIPVNQQYLFVAILRHASMILDTQTGIKSRGFSFYMLLDYTYTIFLVYIYTECNIVRRLKVRENIYLEILHITSISQHHSSTFIHTVPRNSNKCKTFKEDN